MALLLRTTLALSLAACAAAPTDDTTDQNVDSQTVYGDDIDEVLAIFGADGPWWVGYNDPDIERGNATLRSLLADDVVMYEALGQPSTREQYIAHRVDFMPGIISVHPDTVTELARFRHDGELYAAFAGAFHFDIPRFGAVGEATYMNLWRRDGSSWVAVAHLAQIDGVEVADVTAYRDAVVAAAASGATTSSLGKVIVHKNFEFGGHGGRQRFVSGSVSTPVVVDGLAKTRIVSVMTLQRKVRGVWTEVHTRAHEVTVDAA